MTEDSLDERATTVGEGQYKHTSQPTRSPVCYLPLSFSCIFLFHFSRLHRDHFQLEVEMNLSLDLSFLD